jgi:hypothetical protein
MILLDSDVMEDIVRRYPPALQWFLSLKEAPILPGLVVMELVAGCKNKRDLDVTLKAISPLQVVWPDSEQCRKALEDLARNHLSHKLDPHDALIGELAVGLGTTLYTFNEKHFSLIPGLKIQKPYARKVQ